MAVLVSTCDASFVGDFGTISDTAEVSILCQKSYERPVKHLYRQSLLGLTCTSFSPRETRFTISILADLSGLGFRSYSASRIAWSRGLEYSSVNIRASDL